MSGISKSLNYLIEQALLVFLFKVVNFSLIFIEREYNMNTATYVIVGLVKWAFLFQVLGKSLS